MPDQCACAQWTLTVALRVTQDHALSRRYQPAYQILCVLGLPLRCRVRQAVLALKIYGNEGAQPPHGWKGIVGQAHDPQVIKGQPRSLQRAQYLHRDIRTLWLKYLLGNQASEACIGFDKIKRRDYSIQRGKVFE